MTKELDQKKDLPKLSFQACLENLLSKESIEHYRSAFSANLLVKYENDKHFRQVEDLETVDRAKVTEVGLLATKRRVLKEILKEVKKIDIQATKKKNDIIEE